MSRGEEDEGSTGVYDSTTERPIITGYLIKRGRFFANWNRRYFELYPSRIDYFNDESKIMQKGTFKIHANLVVKDCSIDRRPFCLCLFPRLKGRRSDILYFCTYSMKDKKAWVESLLVAISLTNIPTKVSSAIDKQIKDAIDAWYAPGRLFIKVIQGRNLGKDSISPYVLVTVGHSIVRTVSHEDTADAVWNEPFEFELDINSRYACVEIKNEESDSVEVNLGSVQIPLLSIPGHEVFRNWYRLSDGGSKVLGEIEIEFYSNIKSRENDKLMKIFDTIKAMPELRFCGKEGKLSDPTTTSPLSTFSSSYNYFSSHTTTPSSNILSFMDIFPPFDCEMLEDMYSTVALTSMSDYQDMDVFCVGVLFLTNYRLIFVENMRTSASIGTHSTWNATLTSGILIGDMVECVISSHYDEKIGENVDILRIKTADSRIFCFAFLVSGRDNYREDTTTPETREEPEGVAPLESSYVESFSYGEKRLYSEQLVCNFARGAFANVALQTIYTEMGLIEPENYTKFDANDCVEGRAFLRISNRLQWKVSHRYLVKLDTMSWHEILLMKLFGKQGPIEEIENTIEVADTLARRDFSAFSYRKLSPQDRIALSEKVVEYWKLYSPLKEFERMGIPNDKWRLCLVNIAYEKIATYPEVIVVPATVTDGVVMGSIKFRSKGRIPALSWLNPRNGCSWKGCKWNCCFAGKRKDLHRLNCCEPRIQNMSKS